MFSKLSLFNLVAIFLLMVFRLYDFPKSLGSVYFSKCVYPFCIQYVNDPHGYYWGSTCVFQIRFCRKILVDFLRYWMLAYLPYFSIIFTRPIRFWAQISNAQNQPHLELIKITQNTIKIKSFWFNLFFVFLVLSSTVTSFEFLFASSWVPWCYNHVLNHESQVVESSASALSLCKLIITTMNSILKAYSVSFLLQRSHFGHRWYPFWIN